MSRELAKKNLRRCRTCGKAGHNRARCQLLVSAPVSRPKAATIPVVCLEERAHQKINSPHLVDLKRSHHDVWSTVTSVAPTTSSTPLYHYYHQLSSPPRPTTEKNPYLLPNHTKFVVPLLTPVRLKKIAQWWKTLPQYLRALIKNATYLLLHPKKNKQRAQLPPQPKQISLPHTTLSPRAHSKRFPIFLAINLHRILVTGVILLALFISPLSAKSYYNNVKSSAEEVAEHSINGLQSLVAISTALKTSDLTEARNANIKALHHFTLASATLGAKHQLLQGVLGNLPVVGTNVKSATQLVLAGEELSLANSYLLKAAEQVSEATTTPLGARLAAILTGVSTALPNYREALQNLRAVDPEILPIKYQAPFAGFVEIFGQVLHDMQRVTDLERPLLEMFGGTGRRRYLLIFQNHHELRATGGFMGSFAVLDIKDGKIEKLEIPPGGTYDVQGQLNAYIEPPTPLLLTNKRWEFQDANWFADFPTTAEKILWFYRHSRNLTADGVIAINATVLERLLTIVGPITDSNRNLTLTAATALPDLQEIIERGPEKQDHRPKQVVADLAPQFLNMITALPPRGMIPLATGLAEALEQKEVQIYLTDATAQQALERMGWAGRLLPIHPPEDYLLVVNSNIQGGKSDAAITQKISHQAVVAEDGTITDTVTVTREHRGHNDGGLYGQTNIDYLRIYVPEGSTFISGAGFTWPSEQAFRPPEAWYSKDTLLQQVEKEIGVDQTTGTRITHEFGKYVFGNWVITEPGTVSQIQFTYRLPFKAFTLTGPPGGNDTNNEQNVLNSSKTMSRYQLIVQRQSGAVTTFESQIIFPAPWHSIWTDGPSRQTATNGLRIEEHSLKKDTAWSLLMEKK